jgi:hypothetical protein
LLIHQKRMRNLSKSKGHLNKRKNFLIQLQWMTTVTDKLHTLPEKFGQIFPSRIFLKELKPNNPNSCRSVLSF